MNLPSRFPSLTCMVGCLLLLLGSLDMHGAAPADAQIKGALDDIQKYESQFAGQATITAATANRTLKLLGLTRQRLDSSPSRSHATWTEADTRLNALIARLQAGANPAAPAAPSASAPPRPPQSGGTTPAAPAMISQYRVRIQKLIRDIGSAADTLDQGGVKPFQSAEYIAEQLRIAARFKDSLAGYSDFAGDADVLAAGQALTRFENMIAFGQNQASQQNAALGDVQVRLRALHQNLGRVPEPLEPPYADGALREWLAAIATARQAATEALQQLTVIRAQAFLPLQAGTVEAGAPYDMQDVERIEWGYRDNLTKAEQSLAQFSANLDLQVTHVTNTLDHVEGLNPADASAQANSFLGAGAANRVREQLATAHQLVQAAVDFDRQLGRDQLAAHGEMLTRVEKCRADYETKLARARELVRVPRAASTDRTLLAVARDTLQNPSYEVGPIRRLVINVDKVHREMKTSDREFDKVDVSLSGTITLSGTETTYSYAWDEFQVATVEAVGDAFFIYFNTLKNFSSGGPTTPLNRWIVSARFQSSEIPEANIDRN